MNIQMIFLLKGIYFTSHLLFFVYNFYDKQESTLSPETVKVFIKCIRKII